eukprot:scaffold95772_cov66-Phaeocystis_antarctica.AAC.5
MSAHPRHASSCQRRSMVLSAVLMVRPARVRPRKRKSRALASPNRCWLCERRVGRVWTVGRGQRSAQRS